MFALNLFFLTSNNRYFCLNHLFLKFSRHLPRYSSFPQLFSIRCRRRLNFPTVIFVISKQDLQIASSPRQYSIKPQTGPGETTEYHIFQVLSPRVSSCIFRAGGLINQTRKLWWSPGFLSIYEYSARRWHAFVFYEVGEISQ